jgi:hypothetical protein
VLEAVELPARVAELHTGLADVDRNDLPHGATRKDYPPCVLFGRAPSCQQRAHSCTGHLPGTRKPDGSKGAVRCDLHYNPHPLLNCNLGGRRQAHTSTSGCHAL